LAVDLTEGVETVAEGAGISKDHGRTSQMPTSLCSNRQAGTPLPARIP